MNHMKALQSLPNAYQLLLEQEQEFRGVRRHHIYADDGVFAAELIPAYCDRFNAPPRFSPAQPPQRRLLSILGHLKQ